MPAIARETASPAKIPRAECGNGVGHAFGSVVFQGRETLREYPATFHATGAARSPRARRDRPRCARQRLTSCCYKRAAGRAYNTPESVREQGRVPVHLLQRL